MSRCFPYPPPGFEKSSALIDPIKLQKETDKAKKERKEKKREKKDKKDKARGDKGRAEAVKQFHKRRHYEELNQSTCKFGGTAKAREDENEQVEKSSLTEEQGGPAAVQSRCDSSDSTQNSSKRSKHEVAGIIRTTHGNGLRIRLPLSRHKDTESPLSCEQPCFSGRTETVPARRPEPKVAVRRDPPSSAEQPSFSGRTAAPPSEGLHDIADGRAVSVEPGRVHRGGSGRKSSHDRDVRRMYRKLILEWNPPPLPVENPEADDEDWLFGKTSASRPRQHHVGGETGGEQAAVDGAGLGSALCSWPPRARLLPEVGIYALPYVVPF